MSWTTRVALAAWLSAAGVAEAQHAFYPYQATPRGVFAATPYPQSTQPPAAQPTQVPPLPAPAAAEQRQPAPSFQPAPTDEEAPRTAQAWAPSLRGLRGGRTGSPTRFEAPEPMPPSVQRLPSPSGSISPRPPFTSFDGSTPGGPAITLTAPQDAAAPPAPGLSLDPAGRYDDESAEDSALLTPADELGGRATSVEEVPPASSFQSPGAVSNSYVETMLGPYDGPYSNGAAGVVVDAGTSEGEGCGAGGCASGSCETDSWCEQRPRRRFWRGRNIWAPRVEGDGVEPLVLPSACEPECVACDAPRTPWFASAHGLLISRRPGKFLVLAEDLGNGDAVLTTGDADWDHQGGVEVRLGLRTTDCQAVEGVWWRLFADPVTASVLGASTAGGLGTRIDFSDLEVLEGAVANPVDGYFTNSEVQRLEREFSATNVELNVLRLPGCCGPSSLSFTVGTRFLWLDERFLLEADVANTTWGDPTGEVRYAVNVQNQLIGGQAGGQYFRHLSKRFSIFADGMVGVFSNTMQLSQLVRNDQGYATITSGPYAGREMRVSSQRTAVSALGELRVGGHCRFACNWRGTCTYRVTGVSNVALPEDQIPTTFLDLADMHRIRNHGSVLLHGFQFGLEHRF